MGFFKRLSNKNDTAENKTTLVPGVGRVPIPAYRGNKPYIFVSYCHEDSEDVFAEIRRFNEAGFHVWYDQGIKPGTEWPDEIAKALKNCKLFVVFLTKRSVKSSNVADEIHYAIEKKIPAVAIYLEECELQDGLDLRFSRKQAIMKYLLTDEEYNYEYIDAFKQQGLKRKATRRLMQSSSQSSEEFTASENDASYPKAYCGDDDYIFVSYARSEHEIVCKEIRRMMDAGFNVWYDEGTAPGNEFPKPIAEALSHCSLYVVMITPDSMESRNVKNEIHFALRKNKPFVVIYLKETELPLELELMIGHVQAILRYNMSEEEFQDRFIKAFELHGLYRNES